MESQVPLENAGRKQPNICPACGAFHAAKDYEAGCPVYLLRQAMQPEQTAEDDLNRGRFDHYELARNEDGTPVELGRGSMGVTYKGLDTVLHHPVALKLIDAQIAAYPNMRERFLREARINASLRHPNVASIFYYGVRKSDGQCFYAMEWVDGENLDARLRRAGPLAVPDALGIVNQVTQALMAAEEQHIIHRDLKPANLMLTYGPELVVKVIDFGLAKAAVSADETNLTYGGFVGTPVYASPEQFIGSVADVRSDLYSLGVTLWMMLTGRPPFTGSAAEVMRQHQKARLPLQQLKGFPDSVIDVLEVLLEKEPARRFQSAAELLKVISTITIALAARGPITHQGERKIHPADFQFKTRRPRARCGPKKVSIARLPITGSDIFGREEEIAVLDDAWTSRQVNVFTIVAWAGVGKTALVNHWLGRMATQQYRSAEFVFGWSFYTQGTSGDASSADDFFEAALAWFGDPNPRKGTEWEKGERLAKLIAHRRTLLVLDGLEPLQNPPGPQEGRLRAISLQALLRELAAFNKGLCVITTRLPVADISSHERTSALRHDLEHLSSDAGAKLLRALGVRGNEAELRNASNEFRGHCLALTLLGGYLTDVYQGEVRYSKEVSARLIHDVRQGAHAWKVIHSYQSWFGEGPELSVLRIVGLFNRPVDEKVLKALLKPPAIPGLTEWLTDLSPTEWRTILAKLRRANLLALADQQTSGYLDTHPLIREYFGRQLRDQRVDAWQECNRRLYAYYRVLAPSMPDTLKEMEPLFLAVICGCKAGLFHQALNEVYIPRIQRGNVSFAANVLGIRDALLSVLAHFFEEGRWGSLMLTGIEGQGLTAADQLFVLMQTGLLLTATRGLGAPEARLCYERAEPLCRSLDRPPLLYLTLLGQWRYSFMTDKLSAALQLAERVYLLAQEVNHPALVMGACRAFAFTLTFLGDFELARGYARRGVEIWRSGVEESPIEEVNAPALSCMVFEAFCGWYLGEVDFCHTNIAEAIATARRQNDMHGLAVALLYAAILAKLEHNPARTERFAMELIEVATRQHFEAWLAAGAILHGWARAASGNTAEGISRIEEGIREYRMTGSILCVPYCLAIKAEALHLADRTSEALEAIEQAQAMIKATEERWCLSEVHRLQGVFLGCLGAPEVEIEASFRASIRIAKEQKSISMATRAEATQAEYFRQKVR
ncbi:MAG: protein kinase, partial [Verrucomicrobia bacterium]|nr:protein kinase [Verrucomicrobiota bacterium]